MGKSIFIIAIDLAGDGEGWRKTEVTFTRHKSNSQLVRLHVASSWRGSIFTNKLFFIFYFSFIFKLRNILWGAYDGEIGTLIFQFECQTIFFRCRILVIIVFRLPIHVSTRILFTPTQPWFKFFFQCFSKNANSEHQNTSHRQSRWAWRLKNYFFWHLKSVFPENFTALASDASRELVQ